MQDWFGKFSRDQFQGYNFWLHSLDSKIWLNIKNIKQSTEYEPSGKLKKKAQNLKQLQKPIPLNISGYKRNSLFSWLRIATETMKLFKIKLRMSAQIVSWLQLSCRGKNSIIIQLCKMNESLWFYLMLNMICIQNTKQIIYKYLRNGGLEGWWMLSIGVGALSFGRRIKLFLKFYMTSFELINEIFRGEGGWNFLYGTENFREGFGFFFLKNPRKLKNFSHFTSNHPPGYAPAWD